MELHISPEEDSQCVKALRGLCVDIVYNASSGHIGSAMGMAPTAHILFTRFLKATFVDPHWINRDRFVLSNGHSCPLLYSVLHLLNFNIKIEDLKLFRRVGSCTPGHPEMNTTEGIDASTGPLGQGIANGVGMAIASKHLAEKFNEPGFNLIENKIFVFCGDGDMQEGISSEACSLAGHLKLDNLILIYDDNEITIDGSTSLTFTEDVQSRFKSYGWRIFEVSYGDSDLMTIQIMLQKAIQNQDKKPSIIFVKNTIGIKTPQAGNCKSHGNCLDEKSYLKTKNNLGQNPQEKFAVDESTRRIYNQRAICCKLEWFKWSEMFRNYKEKFPIKASIFSRIMNKIIPKEIDISFNEFLNGNICDLNTLKGKATRDLSGKVINIVADILPELIGGSCDLISSNKVFLHNEKIFSSNNYTGRMIYYGVREHAMFAIGNGMASFNLIPFSATFLNFCTYGFPALRICALNKTKHIFIFTHDSIGLGEDGPSHQPIEVLPLLRSTPNLLLVRPADIKEVLAAYKMALKHEGPTAISLCKQSLKSLENTNFSHAFKGAYLIHQFNHFLLKNNNENNSVNNIKNNNENNSEKNKIILIATGSEVSLAMDSAKILENRGISVAVVSCPSTEIFKAQPLKYRRAILPLGVLIVSIEAAATTGWADFAHFSIGMHTFGRSGPSKSVMEFFGFLGEKVAEKCVKYLENGEFGILPVQREFW